MRIIGNDPSVPRQTQEVASGTLPNGKPVVVNADGTVSVVASSGATQSVSSLTKVANSQNYPCVVYDSNSQKIVYLYLNDSTSSLNAVVGTISGSTITFGSVATVSDQPNWLSACFDSTSNKIIAAYADGTNSGKGTAVVGTVSGTSISFGTPVVFEQGLCLYMSCTHDSSNNRTVIAYKDQTNSDYGTSIVGTVSGTSISFGTAVVFKSQQCNYENVVYDTSSQKVAIVYKHSATDNVEGIVGTVSGTSISFGSSQVINENTYANKPVAGYDASANSIVFMYVDYVGGSTAQINVKAAQISGTSLTLGTASAVDTENYSYRLSYAYDATAQKSVFVYSQSNRPVVLSVKVSGTTVTPDTPTQISSSVNYRRSGAAHDGVSGKVAIFVSDTDDSESGNYFIMTTGYTSTNVTSENYIGISRSGAASGAGAIIDTQGAIADNLSGLTAGQSYYVQTDGTLGTTAASPSVFAGTAVSATELIVKG